MTRQNFLRKGLSLGLGLPFLSSLALGADEPPRSGRPFKGKVLIIGAGAAGLAAGYRLKQQGIDFSILEAAPSWGGRIKRADDLADFPLDLGAEWIHTPPSVLADIANRAAEPPEVETIEYNPQTISVWHQGRLRSHNYVKQFYQEWKFKRSTWYGFFESYIVPAVIDHLVFHQPVSSIDYTGDRVRVQTASGTTYEADKVLITASVKVLQSQMIDFVPALPTAKMAVIDGIYMGDGIKIFIACKERFYPDLTGFGRVFQALLSEEKYVYDAAFKKGSDQHILGLFAINEQAAAYTRLGSEADIIVHYLAELDEVFDGQASPNYLRHSLQNWSQEPYIQGAYSYAFDGNRKRMVQALSEPLQNKVYFAGEALSLDHQSTVHGACESGMAAVQRMFALE